MPVSNLNYLRSAPRRPASAGGSTASSQAHLHHPHGRSALPEDFPDPKGLSATIYYTQLAPKQVTASSSASRNATLPPAESTEDQYVYGYEREPENEYESQAVPHPVNVAGMDVDSALATLEKLRHQHMERLRMVESAYLGVPGAASSLHFHDLASIAFQHPTQEEEDIADAFETSVTMEETQRNEETQDAGVVTESTKNRKTYSRAGKSANAKHGGGKGEMPEKGRSSHLYKKTTDDHDGGGSECAQDEADGGDGDMEEEEQPYKTRKIKFTMTKPFPPKNTRTAEENDEVGAWGGDSARTSEVSDGAAEDTDANCEKTVTKKSSSSSSSKIPASKRSYYEYIQGKKQEEEAIKNFKFRANPVPSHVINSSAKDDLEKYNTLLRESREREKQRRRAIITQRERDRQERARREAEEKRREFARNAFKAHPVPDAIRQSSWEDTVLQEQERRERIAAKARELLSEVALPPRMAAYEETLKQKKEEREKKYVEELRANLHHVSRSLPDFTKLHAQLPETQKESTESYVKFRQSALERKARPKRMERIGEVPATALGYSPKGTKTVELRKVMLVKKEEEERLAREKAEAEERKRQERKEMMRSLVAPLVKMDSSREDEERAARRKAFLEAMQQQQEGYQKEVESMYERVSKKPFLFEQVSMDAARTRAEDTVLRTLAKAGVEMENA
ncbi:mitochondrial UPF0564 domain-containing protein [Andalucia godoyi]|uniref:Mitochondrial UPF0564 domain-containing protein n=1 Tax=Andalucia godoyi TaxID=505711 RepID=A0A8K0AHS4_ANDGO|nr:mitochondrial UPF0564 domain-containing protein [Andalucia godoyi]|eukprot:ANDGO_06522.mRNA.1 mitochondrial UPF0564 domain-containing protein